MFDPFIYRHRDKYTLSIIPQPDVLAYINHDLLNAFRGYARERMNIWHRRQKGQSFPWTDNDILSSYKFCNVYRELDRQTIYLHTVLQELKDDFQLRLCNVMMFRFIARIETFEMLGLFTGNAKQYENILRSIEGTKFGDAYLFPPQIPAKVGCRDRIDFICHYLPSIASSLATLIQSFRNISVMEGVDRIVQHLGIGLRFHMTEILIDVAYQYSDLIDLNGEFFVGPGSSPTMKRFHPTQKTELTCLDLLATQPQGFPYLRVDRKIMPITAEGIEGLGCEFRKYSNLQAGKGKKRKYRTR